MRSRLLKRGDSYDYFLCFEQSKSPAFGQLPWWSSTHKGEGDCGHGEPKVSCPSGTFSFGAAQCSALWPPPPPHGSPTLPTTTTTRITNSLALAIHLKAVIIVTKETAKRTTGSNNQAAQTGKCSFLQKISWSCRCRITGHAMACLTLRAQNAKPVLDQIGQLQKSPLLVASCHPQPYGPSECERSKSH